MELYLASSQPEDPIDGSLDASLYLSALIYLEDLPADLYRGEQIEAVLNSIEAYQNTSYEELEESYSTSTGVTLFSQPTPAEDYSRCWTIFQTDRTPGMDYEVFYMVTEDDDDANKITKLFQRLSEESSRGQDLPDYWAKN